MAHLNGYMFDNNKKGQIQIIFGPMFSGKTTELIRRLKRYRFADYRCMLVRYANDNRYSTKDVSTHEGHRLPAISAVKLADVNVDTSHFDVIGIDEGQFFPDTVEFCERMANAGKIVVVAALDGTYQRERFGSILDLVPLAENVVKLTAVCMSCFNDAAFTKRIGSETQVEIIGGVERYMAVCRECHKLEAPVKRSPFKQINGVDESIKPSGIAKNLFNEMETS
ncbi:thymidine kinase, cytosolic-like isoform X3 [Macrosteles quadrilineatus]|uniref:thymidine kinase, cytosolic-like isoform X3 n=1 Tax=Macrosteles quadrilineatus TaxID=74068 RepID=UPI0023E10207|nr:thymidine kinase, cytosolic-like isoform X3 [Macrosteles quadrilineatus]